MSAARLLALFVAVALTLPVAAQARSTADGRDDLAGPQVHLVYAVPKDGKDNGLDRDGTIATTVASFQRWMGAQTGGRRFRLDTAGGRPDVTFLRLPSTGAALAAKGAFIRDEIERLLRTAGFVVPEKLYAVYYDGISRGASCGNGPFPPDLPGVVAAEYLHGDPESQVPCDTNRLAGPGDAPGYLEFVMAHELVHALGFVPRCAPNAVSSHVDDDPSDLMYAGSEPWRPTTLDVGRDDYYGANVPGCRDLSASTYLSGPGDAVCRVPALAGATAKQAAARLAAARCGAPVTSRRVARTAKERRRIGTVAAQSARTGATGPRGARVGVTLLTRR